LQFRGQAYSTVYSNHFGIDKVIVNRERTPGDIFGIVPETKIYSLIQAFDIGPRFLAHVTENRDRVIGYMVERLPGRHVTTEDLPAYRAVLFKLHGLDIAHGFLRLSSFLITNDRALLHFFT
jgi:hypothetical protein